MLNGHEQMKRFATAARTLMEKGYVDVDAGMFSKTLFMSVTHRDSSLEARARRAAVRQGWGMVALEFGRTGRAKGPLSYTVSFLKEGATYDVVHDCTLVRDGDDTFVLVPAAATFHFAIGSGGLERRHGRPSNVGAGAIRATRALIEAAKHADRNAPFLEAQCLEDVA